MTGQQGEYRAYMLRLWRVTSGGAVIWRASLEDPAYAGERKGFADLESLLAFLREETTAGVDTPPLNRECNDNG